MSLNLSKFKILKRANIFWIFFLSLFCYYRLLDIKIRPRQRVVQIVSIAKEHEFTGIFTMLILVGQYREQRLQLQQQQAAEHNVQAPVQVRMAGVARSRETQQVIQAVITILPELTALTVLLIVAGVILLLGD